jgi:transcriptional regulator with XRE-family HTH domain
MNHSTTVTSVQSKAARASLGVSQTKVANATGINRTQLALFEVRKYLLDDARQKTLRKYYEGLGYDFGTAPRNPKDHPSYDPDEAGSDGARTDSSDSKVVDRFVIPAGLEDEALESLLAEIDANDRQIDELSQTKAEVNWFSGKPAPETRDEILRLMARNYLRIRQLQAGSANEGEAVTRENQDEPTCGEVVAEAIGLPFGRLSSD